MANVSNWPGDGSMRLHSREKRRAVKPKVWASLKSSSKNCFCLLSIMLYQQVYSIYIILISKHRALCIRNKCGKEKQKGDEFFHSFNF